MNKEKRLFLPFMILFFTGCVTQQPQGEEYERHSISSVRIRTEDQIEHFYDDPLYYYHNEFDWLYLN